MSFTGENPSPLELEARGAGPTAPAAGASGPAAPAAEDDVDELPQFKYTYRFRKETDHKHPLSLPKEGPYSVQSRALAEAKQECNALLSGIMAAQSAKQNGAVGSGKRTLPSLPPRQQREAKKKR
jgi:hypothetical protein